VVLGSLLLPSIVVVLGLLARSGYPEAPGFRRALESRLAPGLVGLASALFLATLWGSLREPGVVHDEAAYLLQARIFASFRLAADPPPLPEFFEQYHVLVTPRLAPKYLPGHALALVPGMWAGLPGLMPVLLHGVAAGFLFALARRLAGAGVAALTWSIWLSAPLLNLWRCSYYSQSTSTALWLAGAWLLLEWWEGGQARHLVGVGLVVAGLAITRPWTALAYVTPLAIVVLLGVWRHRRFGSLLLAAGAGAALLCVIPIWNQASLGDWRELPYSRYSALYFPYQHVGFGCDPAPPLRELPPDMQGLDREFRKVYESHTLANLPRDLAKRAAFAGADLWGGSWERRALPLFLLIGLLGIDRRGWFAVAWAVSPLLWYACFAHPADWSIYYLESHPSLAFVIAVGLCRSLSCLATGSLAWDAGIARKQLPPVLLLGLLGLAAGARSAPAIMAHLQGRQLYHRSFQAILEAIPDPRAVVFVRYAPRHDHHRSLIENPPDHREARIWVVRDRGEDDARLLSLAPERAAYLFDEEAWALHRLVPR
jgi:hypothetical protein